MHKLCRGTHHIISAAKSGLCTLVSRSDDNQEDFQQPQLTRFRNHAVAKQKAWCSAETPAMFQNETSSDFHLLESEGTSMIL